MSETAATALAVEEYERFNDLRWRADMQAIKQWQEDTGRTLVLPDHADLCLWLLERNDKLLKALAGLTTACATNAAVMDAISLAAFDEAVDAEANYGIEKVDD